MTRVEVALSAAITEENTIDLSQFADAETVVLTGAVSPQKTITYEEDGAHFTAGTTVTWPVEVVLQSKPESLTRIEIELVGDLLLSLGQTAEQWQHRGPRFQDTPAFVDELILRSANSPNVVVVGPAPGRTIVDGPALGVQVGHIQSGGEHRRGAGSRLARLTFRAAPHPATLGQLSADVLVLPVGTRELDLGVPGPNDGGWLFSDVTIGEVQGPSDLCIRADRTVKVSKVPNGTTVVLGGEDVGLGLGRDVEPAAIVGLTVSAPRVQLVRGVIDGLTLAQVGTLELGPKPPDSEDRDPSTMRAAYEAALDEVVGMATATRVTGEVDRLVVHRGCTIAGDVIKGFSAHELSASDESEVSGVAAQQLSLSAIVNLGRVVRSGLWVPWSSRAARRQFEHEARAAHKCGRVELERLANRRARLLEHAVASAESGHVLSVLREAEKDARRRLLPLRSRERALLAMSRWMVGYGERIGWPLAVGAVLLALLAGLQVGWANLTSSDWWSGFAHVDRYETAIEFALPGLDVLGVEAAEGLWGLLAKLVSVVFIATAVRAGFRIMRRRE